MNNPPSKIDTSNCDWKAPINEVYVWHPGSIEWNDYKDKGLVNTKELIEQKRIDKILKEQKNIDYGNCSKR